MRRKKLLLAFANRNTKLAQVDILDRLYTTTSAVASRDEHVTSLGFSIIFLAFL